jgi:hypothetical protein
MQKQEGLTKYSFCHSGVIDTSVTRIGDFLCEFKAIFKKALTRVYSKGPRGSCLMKKARGRKSRVRVPNANILYY